MDCGRQVHGDINTLLWDKKEEIILEISKIVPVLKENGGYIFASDHSIPSSVSTDNLREIIKAVKLFGAY